jgi:DNA-binding MarR family transcriptional regulator
MYIIGVSVTGEKGPARRGARDGPSGFVNQTELGRAARLDRSDVTHTVRALEERALLRRVGR